MQLHACACSHAAYRKRLVSQPLALVDGWQAFTK